MSYIVPMQKPVCQNCYFRVGRYCGIIESTEQVPVKKNRCPLVEIPTPHGRLIDKDKLRHELFTNFNGERIPFYDCDGYPIDITYRELHSILSEQKTIIEAEGKT